MLLPMGGKVLQKTGLMIELISQAVLVFVVMWVGGVIYVLFTEDWLDDD